MQALLSLHTVPFVATGFEQLPVTESQVPATWHWSLAAHVFPVPPPHTPAWQVSPVVQALLSLHAVPFAFATGAGQPVAGTQLPTVWHWSAAQVTVAPPPHTPV